MAGAIIIAVCFFTPLMYFGVWLFFAPPFRRTGR
jgi:hypothetical protein